MALPSPSPDTTCLITAAGSGVGEHLARGLATRGHNLTLVARRETRVGVLAEELTRTTGVEALAISCDLSAAGSRRELVEQVRSADRDVSVLVNNAELGTGGPFADLDGESESRMVRVNTEAVVDLCSVYATPMVRRGGGAILNIASVAGFVPVPGQATYAATRAFVIHFGHALHAELKREGVAVTTLCTGPTRTEIGETSGLPVHDAIRRPPRFMTAQADNVAEAGLRALERGQRQVTVGVINKVNATSAYFTPRSLQLAVMDRFSSVGR